MSPPRLFVVLLFLLSTLCSCIRAETESDYAKTPVFFVHGCGMSAEGWNKLISYLQESGYSRLFLRAIQLDPNDGLNIPAAENQIAPAIEQFLRDVNDFLYKNYPQIPSKTKVDLISHSMGSLSSRWYTIKIRPDRVRYWVSIAGANHGTDDLCPYIGTGNNGADDCCPAFAERKQDSYIQYQLNGAPCVADLDETPYGLGTDSPGVDSVFPDNHCRVLYVTIRTMNDRWISPDESVILDGAGGMKIPIPDNFPATETSPGNIQMEKRVGHDQMISDPNIMRLVRIILDLEKQENKIMGKSPKFPREKRQYPRMLVPVLYRPAKKSKEKHRISNLGMGGVRIYSNERLEPGQELDPELFLPNGFLANARIAGNP
jgi:pimeloyl-ACP methyl ester carboxylesterase